MNKKKTVLVVALVISMIAIAVGGTLAWLTATDDAVVNTFTPAGIEITLTETFNTDSNNDNSNEALLWINGIFSVLII